MSDPSQPDPNSLAERWRRSQEDGEHARNDRSDIKRETNGPDEPEIPARCPACRSQDVKTTSKVASADAVPACSFAARRLGACRKAESEHLSSNKRVRFDPRRCGGRSVSGVLGDDRG